MQTVTTKLEICGEIYRVKYKVVEWEDEIQGKFNGIVILEIDGEKPDSGLRHAAIEILEPIHNQLKRAS